MAINGFPAAIQNVIEQVGYLETKLRRGLHAKLVLRQAAAASSLSYFDAQIGETKTFSRSNPIAPNSTPLNPASNTGLDNGVTLSARGFEQWQAQLNEWPGGVNLNLLGNETLAGDLYIDNMYELGKAAANSLEVICVGRAITAYDSGDTFARTAGATATTALAVDNINGFTTQYQSSLSPSFGLPAPVSATNKLAVMCLNGATGAVKWAANVQAAVADGTNASIMQTGGNAFGVSGVLTLDAAQTWVAGDRIVAMDANNPSTTSFNPNYKDGAYIVRPLVSGVMVQDSFNMAATNTFVPSIAIPQMVAKLKARQAPKLRNGLYGIAIDSILLAAAYQDQGFIYATQGTFDKSPVFTDGIIAKGWGAEIVESTQLPVYNAPAGGFALRHAFAFGEDVLSEHPFVGAKTAQSRAAEMGDIVDTRWVDRIQFISQVPLDRLNEVYKLSYKYIGDFQPGTDKGSNPSSVFTSDYCRYKRGVLGQFASSI